MSGVWEDSGWMEEVCKDIRAGLPVPYVARPTSLGSGDARIFYFDLRYGSKRSIPQQFDHNGREIERGES